MYDLGGGLGVRYTYDDEAPSIPSYLDALVGAAERLPAGAELIIEPGRSMVAATALTLYSVVTVKRGARTFAAVDGGMGDNLEVVVVRPTVRSRTRRSPADGDARRSPSSAVTVRVATSWSTASLAAPRSGPVAIPATGAYCYTMANNYNGNRRIPVVFAAGGERTASSSAGRPGTTSSHATSSEQRAGHIHAQSFRWTPMPVHTPRDGRSADHRGRV